MAVKKKTEKKETKKAAKKEAKEKPKKEAKARKETVQKEVVKKESARKTEAKAEGRKIKGIIFDFWGTLVENGVFPSPIRQAYKMFRLNMTFPEYIVPFEATFMTTRYDDLFHAFDAVFSKFGINPPGFIKDRLVGMWNKNKMFAKPYEETVQVLEELKKDGYKIALISNTDCFSLRDVMEKFGLGKYFDSIALSYEANMLKSNPEMFRKILDEIGLSKDEVIMVGDSVESDIKAAENAGIRSILIDRRNRREFEGKILSLTELKGVVEKI